MHEEEVRRYVYDEARYSRLDFTICKVSDS